MFYNVPITACIIYLATNIYNAMALPVVTNNSAQNIAAINTLVAQQLPQATIYGEELHNTFSFITGDLIRAISNNDNDTTAHIVQLLNDVVALSTPEGDDVIGTTVFIGLFDEFYENQQLIPLEQFSPQTQALYNSTIAYWKQENNLG